MNKKAKIQIHLFLIISLFLLFLISGVTLPYFPIRFSFLTFGGKLMQSPVSPDIMLCFSIICGLLVDKKNAAIYGLIFGFLSDILINNPFMFSAIVYFLAGYLSGKLYENFAKLNVLTLILISFPLLFMRSFVTLFNLLAIDRKPNIFSLVFGNILPEYIVNFVSIVILFLFFKKLYLAFERKFQWKEI